MILRFLFLTIMVLGLTSARAEEGPNPACEKLLLTIQVESDSQSESLAEYQSLEAILSHIQQFQDRTGIHPDRVLFNELEELAPGTELFLDPEAFRRGRPEEIDGRRLSSRSAYPVRVLRASRGTLTLINSDLGMFTFKGDSYSGMLGNLYRRPDYETRSPYENQEYVQVGHPSAVVNRQPIYLYDPSQGRSETLEYEHQPYPAKFLRAVSLTEYEVYFDDVNGRGPMRAIIANTKVNPLRNGSAKRLREAFKILDKIPMDVRIGERVRYVRGGLMKSGRVTEFGPRSVTIDGHLHLSKTAIYKTWTKGKPQSIAVDTTPYIRGGPEKLRVHLGHPRGPLREYLNAVARFSSHPEFVNASFEWKLKLLVAFQELFLPWRESGLNIENNGVQDFSEILCMGTGVCRHNTPLYAAVLAEAGLIPKIQYRYIDMDMARRLGMVQTNGHTWLHVRSTEEVPETYIVDPSFQTVVNFKTAIENAKKDVDSADAFWWTNPDRNTLQFNKLYEEIQLED